MFSYLQKLGKSLMLPIAVLPICGILMGIGYMMCPSAMSSNVDTVNLLSRIGFVLVKIGLAVIDNMPILFVIGVSLGMSDDNHGAVCLAAIVSWLVLTNFFSKDVVNVIIHGSTKSASLDLAYTKIANPFTAIIIGVLSATCYNKYKNIKFIDTFAFFSGRRFVIIIVVFATIVLSFILLVVWNVVFSMLVLLGTNILKLKGIGVGIYTFLNRLLIPLGLHHALNNVFWFDTIGIGDLTAYWAGKTSMDVNWDVGMYMAGFFPCMMFGVPGASLAIIKTAEDRKKAIGIVLSSAICAFVCGLTEPFEFSFMFIAFPLYVIYSILFGIFSIIAYYVGFRAGFSFSAGLLDLIFSSSLPAAKNTILIIPLGISAFVVFYLVFYFFIKKFKLNLFPKEDNTKNINNSLSENILKGLGGKNNIKSIDCCATRLRVELNDGSFVNENIIKTSGALGFVKVADNVCQVIVGFKVQQVLEEIKNIMQNNNINKDKKIIKHGDIIKLKLNQKDEDNITDEVIETYSIDYVIKSETGIHARPAGKLVELVKNGKSKVLLKVGEKIENANSIIGIMSLGITKGTAIELEIKGSDAKVMKKKIEEFLSKEL